MITQAFMDVIAHILAFLLDTMPPLPGEVSATVGSIASSGSALASSLTALGPVVPFPQIALSLALFPVAFGYWLVITAVRLILWMVNR